MQKKLANVLFSTRLTAVLFIVFAAAMATGTFLDASSETSPTPYTRAVIYNAWWFEAIMGLFVVNFVGNIFRYKMYRKEKWTALVFHLAFILTIVGAAVTRYIGYEGVMQIREGATSNILLSEHPYLTIFVDGDYEINGVPQRLTLTPQKMNLSPRLDNHFAIERNYNQQPFKIEYKDFLKGAKQGFVENENGDRYLKLVESGGGQGHDHWLKEGQVQNIHNVLFAFNAPTEGAINIMYDPATDFYTMNSPFEGSYINMAALRASGVDPRTAGQNNIDIGQFQNQVISDSIQDLQLRSLYQMADMSFVIPDPVVKGRQGIVKAEANEDRSQDGLFLDITSNGETKTIALLGGRGTIPVPKEITVGGLDFYVSYASKEIELPFSLTLNDFIATKYPGTEKGYASFQSNVTVTEADGTIKDEEIYMNHVLDKNGYRFFQSSFDSDEKGTILSVNHDTWGTWITYIGYFFIYLGMMAIWFDRKSRFGNLKKTLKKVKKKKAELLSIVLLCFSLTGFAQNDTIVSKQNPEKHSPENHTPVSKTEIDSIIIANAVPKVHANTFANLIIQDNGRMKPVNTYASELLRKISGKNYYETLDANQVFLSMTEFPKLWLEVPLIKLKRGNDSIRKIIGVPLNTKHVSLLDLFDKKDASYKLEPYLNAATTTNTPNQFQKDFIKAHESFYILNEALVGSVLKIFPVAGDENNKWIAQAELSSVNLKPSDSSFVKTFLPVYATTLRQGRATGDYSKANEVLEVLKQFQEKNGASVMPDENKVKAEIFYNKADIFNRLYKYYLLMGAFMFIGLIIQIFKESKGINWFVKGCKVIIWTFFVIMTLGLILRWYISGHAPWSNAYESIIYVAWATVFFGLAFGRKSDLTIAATAFVASIVLWVAHLSWVDPEIATLQPVLDSYWLMIHVAVIVASYGPFTLGWILGITSMILMLMTNKKNFKKMDLNIKEITIISELALTIGLSMLTIGNFLGGQWANESWGRYWGWDPKETWALISIMVYAFVLHMRLVPGLRGKWTFNFASVIAFASIMMTYFGVNFYLTGLHSYASGDVPVTPNFVFYIIIFIIILSITSFINYKKYYIKK